MPLGTSIRMIRELKCLSQDEVARQLNMSPQAYGKLERNETAINIDRLDQIANVFNVSADFIKEFDTEKIFVTQSFNTKNNNNNSHNSINDKLVENLEKTIDTLRSQLTFLNKHVETLQNQNQKLLELVYQK
jgi:transcriptional regulator with XRE-family HTH domain